MVFRGSSGTSADIDSKRNTSATDETDPGSCAHIVHTDRRRNAPAIVLQARIEGTALKALCGYVFVPQKDPKSLPVCAECKEIYELMRMMDERYPESPKS